MESSSEFTAVQPDTEANHFEYSTRLCWPGCRRIRIIELFPRAAETPGSLKITLHEIDLDQHPEYDAISYCWGGQQPTFPITCNGAKPKITQNLADALLTLSRDIPQSIWLWADAICINQSDDSEKSVQVGLMRDIYRSAKMVHVWLGLEAPPGCIQKINMFLDEVHNSTKQQDHTESEDEERAMNRALPWSVFNAFTYGPLCKLLGTAWFSRVWILQEIALSQDAILYWGGDRINWTKLLSVLFFLRVYWHLDMMLYVCSVLNVEERSPEVYSSLLDTCIVLKYAEAEISLSVLYLLVRHREAFATDLRDKVYTVLGLVTEGMDLGIKVDYSLKFVTVYMNVATSIIRGSKYLDILSVPRTDETNVSLPSWVPDWSSRLEPSLVIDILNTPGIELYQASGQSNSDHGATIHGDRLEVQAWTFDCIEEIGPVHYAMRDKAIRGKSAFLKMILEGSSQVDTFYEWQLVSHCRRGRLYPTGEDSFEVFLRTIFENEDEGRPMSFRQLRRKYWGIQMASHLSWLLRVLSLHHLPILYGVLVGFCFGLHSVLIGICFCIFRLLNRPWNSKSLQMSGVITKMCLSRTKKSYIAVVPPTAAAEDSVMLVKGSRVPLVLRKRDNATWELIGHAYVPGLMRGEQWNEAKCGKVIIS